LKVAPSEQLQLATFEHEAVVTELRPIAPVVPETARSRAVGLGNVRAGDHHVDQGQPRRWMLEPAFCHT
jgi:hypothetical protein